MFKILPDFEEKLLASSTSPLRVITTIEKSIGNTGYIDISFNSPRFNLPANSLAFCTIRDQTTYGLSYLTSCSYDSSSNLYSLKNLDIIIPIGRYLIEVTFIHDNLLSEGVTFPANEQRSSLSVSIFPESNQTPLSDSIGISAAPSNL